MQSTYRALLTLLLVATLAACQSSVGPNPATGPDTASVASAGPTAPTKAETRIAVTAALTRMTDAWNRHDMNGFGAVFHDDASFINIFGHQLVGRSKIITHHEMLHQRHFRDTQLIPENTEVHFVDDDIAVAMVSWKLEGARDPRTDELVPSTVGIITATLHWDSSASDWQIIALQNGRTLPIPGAPL